MKPKGEKILIRTKSKSTISLSLIRIVHITIIILITQFIIYLLLIIKTQSEIIRSYQLKEQIRALNAQLESFEEKFKESENVIKAFKYEKETLMQTKNTFENALINRKQKRVELDKKLKNSQHYKELARRLSVVLSPKYIQKIIIYTNCTFIDICYRMTCDGYSAKVFHEKCDGLKPTVVIINDDVLSIFGGFTHESWDGNELKFDSKAFMFSLKFNNKFDVKENKPAINACPLLLPTFGEDDLYIDEHSSYLREPLKSYSYPYGNEQKDYFRIKEIEVFHMKCNE